MMNVAKQSQMAGGMNMGFVVIAEPDEVNAARIKTILDSLDKDFSYALVGSAEAAIQLVEQNTTDVFIADMQMPVMNGYEATANIRAGKSDYWKTIPVIAMTANVFQEDESRAAECGMSDYVTKPIDMNVIYSVLEKWLRGQKG